MEPPKFTYRVPSTTISAPTGERIMRGMVNPTSLRSGGKVTFIFDLQSLKS